MVGMQKLMANLCISRKRRKVWGRGWRVRLNSETSMHFFDYKFLYKFLQILLLFIYLFILFSWIFFFLLRRHRLKSVRGDDVMWTCGVVFNPMRGHL